MKKTGLFLLLYFLFFPCFSQTTISLKNPSFEDVPRHSKAPLEWADCGFPNESPPDVHGSSTNIFKVNENPSHGETFLGMTVRDNETWESISQRLNSPLQKDSIYRFSIDLRRSEIYVSLSRRTSNEVNYTSPVKLRVWGGNSYCHDAELLAETPLIIHSYWQKHTLVFAPKEDYKFILLEAFYKTPTRFPYNGNLLLDNASDITGITQEEADSLIEINPLPVDDYFMEEYARSTVNYEEEPQVEKIDWAEAGAFTEDIREWLDEMIILVGNDFSEGTEKQMLKILEDLKYGREFDYMVVGIMGKKNRQKRLRGIFTRFLEEQEIDPSLIRFEKVEVGDRDENWVGKNRSYRIRLE